MPREDWQKMDNGAFAFHKLSPGGHLLQLMGRLPSGEIVYSETFPFTAEKGKEYNFSLEMKPGIRLEGRIDDQGAEAGEKWPGFDRCPAQGISCAERDRRG